MKTLKLYYDGELPENYTGIVDYGYCIEYYLNGLLHREDGPAIIYPDGRIRYYLYGKRHRTDGPAVTHPNGNMYYYLNDKNISTKEVNDWIKENNIPEVWNNSHKILFKLTFG